MDKSINCNEKNIMAVIVVKGLLGACADREIGRKEMIGTLIGNGTGALAGSQIVDVKGKIAAVSVVAQLGTFPGNEIRKSFDKFAQAAQEKASGRAHTAPIGKMAVWSNSMSGNSETVMLNREVYHTGNGSYCGELKQMVRIDSRRKEAFGMFRRQLDASWMIKS